MTWPYGMNIAVVTTVCDSIEPSLGHVLISKRRIMFHCLSLHLMVIYSAINPLCARSLHLLFGLPRSGWCTSTAGQSRYHFSATRIAAQRHHDTPHLKQYHLVSSDLRFSGSPVIISCRHLLALALVSVLLRALHRYTMSTGSDKHTRAGRHGPASYRNGGIATRGCLGCNGRLHLGELFRRSSEADIPHTYDAQHMCRVIPSNSETKR